MSNSSVRGNVHFVGETESVGQKGFRKRLVVLEQQNGRFTNYVPIEFAQDQVDSCDDFLIGDEIEVSYFLNGRKWQKDPNAKVQYFLACQASSWRVLSTSGGDVAVVDDQPFSDEEELSF